MTRINCIPVTELCDKHLVAEHKEILRLPNMIRRWLAAKKPATIPDTYRMGTGHVAFFYNKVEWLINRHYAIVEEMWQRGFIVNHLLADYVDDLPAYLFNNWIVTDEALLINKERIAERLFEMGVPND